MNMSFNGPSETALFHVVPTSMHHVNCWKLTLLDWLVINSASNHISRSFSCDLLLALTTTFWTDFARVLSRMSLMMHYISSAWVTLWYWRTCIYDHLPAINLKAPHNTKATIPKLSLRSFPPSKVLLMHHISTHSPAKTGSVSHLPNPSTINFY